MFAYFLWGTNGMLPLRFLISAISSEAVAYILSDNARWLAVALSSHLGSISRDIVQGLAFPVAHEVSASFTSLVILPALTT